MPAARFRRTGRPLSAANKRHDFELVSVVKITLRVAGSRDEFEVAFHRDEFRLHAEFFQQAGNGLSGCDLASFSVNCDLHR